MKPKDPIAERDAEIRRLRRALQTGNRQKVERLKNHETWQIAAAIDNEPQLRKHWLHMARAVPDAARLAEDLEAAHRHYIPKPSPHTPLATYVIAPLIESALNRVDWLELANDLLEMITESEYLADLEAARAEIQRLRQAPTNTGRTAIAIAMDRAAGKTNPHQDNQAPAICELCGDPSRRVQAVLWHVNHCGPCMNQAISGWMREKIRIQQERRQRLADSVEAR